MEKEHVYNLCVIGAGIIGSSAAHHASKHNKNVVLCDQFPLGHSRGSSHGHSRIIRRSYADKHFGSMMPESYEIWQELESLTKTDLLITTGLLSLEDKPWKSLESVIKPLVELKAEFKHLDQKSLKEDFSMLQYSNSYNGVYEPEGGVLKADKCCAAFQTLFKQNGGDVRENCQVKEIIPGNVVKIVTNNGIIRAKSVILAAGPWTNDLLRPLAVKLPLKPMKINVCYWKADPSLYSAAKGFPCFIDYSLDAHIYGLPAMEYPGMLKACYHYGNEHHPDSRDLVNDERGIEIVGEYLKKHFKAVADKPAIVEKCYYTWTPDENFIIDYHPAHRNIVIGAGFSGHGFKHAPVTGKILCQLAMNTKPDYDISHFRISRFDNTSSLKSAL